MIARQKKAEPVAARLRPKPPLPIDVVASRGVKASMQFEAAITAACATGTEMTDEVNSKRSGVIDCGSVACEAGLGRRCRSARPRAPTYILEDDETKRRQRNAHDPDDRAGRQVRIAR